MCAGSRNAFRYNLTSRQPDNYPAIEVFMINDHQIFDLGDIDVQSGLRIRDANLAYKTYGEDRKSGG